MVSKELIEYWEDMDADSLKVQIEHEEGYIHDYELEADLLKAEIAVKENKLRDNIRYNEQSKKELDEMKAILKDKEGSE